MKTTVIFAIVIVLLIFGCTGETKTSIQSAGANMYDNSSIENSSMMHKNESMKESDHMTDLSFQGQLIAGHTTPYIRYNEPDFNKAVSKGKIVYLYFYATWCPVCASERPNIFAAFNQMNYSDVVGFEVHYKDDQSNDQDNVAIEKFQIPYQHSTIILNSKGSIVFKTFSPLSTNDVLSQIAQARQS